MLLLLLEDDDDDDEDACEEYESIAKALPNLQLLPILDKREDTTGTSSCCWVKALVMAPPASGRDTSPV